jgi:hypothetical protein
MAAGWVEAVRDLWVQDAEIDLDDLERIWQLRTFETSGGEATTLSTVGDRGRLLCCLTGFDDADQRQHIIDTITANGGGYTGDLTRKVTHLIVCKPEGRKYSAAKNWNIQTVSIEWLQDSVERGMILDEKSYDPILPPEERGKGAWLKRELPSVSLGKRIRESAAAAQEESKRKLRKTASMKLSSQRDNIWGDILGKPPSADAAGPAPDEPTQPNTAPFEGRKSMDTQDSRLASLGNPDDGRVFSSCCFYIHDFAPKKAEILVNTVAYLGGLVCHSLVEVASNSGAQLAHRFLIVPQDSKAESHPALPNNVQIITEFFIEKCMHKKQLFDAGESVIGRPFPAFPISGFEKLAICTAGFTGVDLNQVDKAIRQLGGRYEERFTAQCSVLVCSSLASVRKQKLDVALAWKVPVVSADWLWACISTGFNVPIKRYLFPELRQRLTPETTKKEDAKPATKQISKANIRDIDRSAFIRGDDAAAPTKDESNTTAEFDTALTHQPHSHESSHENKQQPAPLTELSSSALNKPSSARNQALQPPPRKPRARISSEIANSAPTDDDDFDENANAGQKDGRVAAPPLTTALASIAVTESILNHGKAVSLATAEDNTKIGTTAEGSVGASDSYSGMSFGRSFGTGIGGGVAGRRRRRQIIGRAVSNVSAGSTTSADSPAVNAPRQAESAAARSLGLVDGGDAHVEAVVPPPTQLEYEDPQAKRCRARVMRKLMLGSGAADLPPAEPAVPKITLAEMAAGATAYPASPAGVAGAVAGGAAARLGLRSRKR